MMAFLGVDPGVAGGLALLREDGTVAHIRAFSNAMTEREFVTAVDTAAGLLSVYRDRFCVMEKVGFIKGDGGKGSFTFGKVVGLIRGCLLTRGISVSDVYPVIWQARMECMTGGNKNISKRRAQELFPCEKITHAIADALLIAEYGRRAQLALHF